MTTIRTLLSDRTGLLGSAGAMLTGLPPWAIYTYLLLRVIIPVLLIVMATHGATPAQKIGLVGAYLMGQDQPKGVEQLARPADAQACCDHAQSEPDPNLEP